MGCSGRAKAEDVRADQKWDFISLGDFKSNSCFTPFAYAYLIGSLIVSIAVYGVDTFTAVNLLVFDRWSGKIKPAIPLSISKWIFSACIIASWVNLGYEYWRALRVMKRGAVVESYLDSLAVRLQCIRFTKTGRGWRRFLVFAELTKSTKGTEYIALFTYFSFQSWIRVIICQGPRQVVNALTLYAVLQASLLPKDTGNVGTAIGEFFEKIAFLAKEDNQQAVILSGMLFTLVIWVFAALSLILAVLFYIFFLWHYIPNSHGGLSGYCENKTNKKLASIVSVKVNKAIEEEERKRKRADVKALKNGEKPAFGRQATLPTLFDAKGGDKLPQMPILNRNETTTTLPLYTSRPGTPGSQPTVAIFELDQLDSKRPVPSRSVTGTSFGSNAPLMGNASDMGYGRSESPAPSLPAFDRNGYPVPQRPGTANSQNSQWNRPPPRMPSAMGDRGFTASPAPYDNNTTPSHMSNNSQGSVDTYGRPLLRGGDPRSNTPGSLPMGADRNASFNSGYSDDRNPSVPYHNSEHDRNSAAPFRGPNGESGRNTPASFRGPGTEYGRNSPAPSAMGPTPSNNGPVYQAYNPNSRSASSAGQAPPNSSSRPGPGSQQYRNMTDPGMAPPRAPSQGAVDYFGNGVAPQRPGTSQSNRQPNNPRVASPGTYNDRNGYGGQSSQGSYR